MTSIATHAPLRRPLRDAQGSAEPDTWAADATDELLDRARRQWQQGDWDQLAQTTLADIESHPLRARLALLISAGHQQLGRVDDARRFATQALAWGCERRAVAQVLISGIHGTLARAAALTDDAARTRHHLQAALSIAYPGQDVCALVEQRLNTLQDGMRLAAPPVAPSLSATIITDPPRQHTMTPDTPADAPAEDEADDGSDGVAPTGGAAPAAGGLPPGLATHMKRSMNSLRRLQQDLAQVRHDVDAGLRQVLQQQAVLLESYVSIGRAVDGLAPLPSLQGWAVSADLAAYLMKQVSSGGHDAVIEFGSGSSTALIALGLAPRRACGQVVPHLAFEHHAGYLAETLSLLQRHAPGSPSQALLAPLRPWLPAGTGVTAAPALFYDCDAALATLTQALAPLPRPRLLVLVDGPPAATGPQARYPALPTLLAHFGHAKIDLVVDDYGRKDDRAVVDRWQAELQAAGRSANLEELHFVKAACRLNLAAGN